MNVLLPQRSYQTPTLSHHHLFSPNASSTQPPPNFLLQPPPPPLPPPQQRKAQDLQLSKSNTTNRNFTSTSRLTPHGPAPPPPSQQQQHRQALSSVSALLASPSLSFQRPTNLLDEMARRKRSPNSIRWNNRGLAQTAHPDVELAQCQICMTQIRSCGDLKSPVEQVDYFVDDDGTLTIKNDICPRTVALSLLCGDSQSQKTYRSRLGEDYNMFVLNLEQILKKHPQTCPGELARQVARAEALIHEHHLRQKLLSHSRKRTHELMSRGDSDRDNLTIKASQPEAILTIQKGDDEERRPAPPDNFLSIPSSREQTPPPHVGKKSENNNNLPLTLSESNIPKSIFDCDNNNNTNTNNNFGNDSGQDDKESKEEAKDKEGSHSRPISPASLISQGMTVAEAAIANKQMANTKRGSKILPVSASTDGLVKYQCPICSLELSGDHELTVHIRSHNQSHLQVMPNTCTICGKTLSSQSSLDRHMLVHSGERPFKCHICDMSFTTNGNMHRHSRIHKKNGIDIKPIGRKSNESKSSKGTSSSNNNSNNNNSNNSQQQLQHHPSQLSSSSSSSAGSSMQPQFPSTFRDDPLSTPKRKGGHHSSAPPHQHQPDQSVEFLHYMNDIKNLQQFKLLSMSNYMFPFNAAPATHSAFPISPYIHEQLRLQYLQAYINPLNGESLAKRPCYPPFLVPPPRAPSPDLREPTVHRCRECDDEFTNQFALESHMETHVIVDEKMEAEAGTACKTCKTVAKSAESLLLHTLTHHKAQEDFATPDPQPEPSLPSKESSSSPSTTSDMNTEAITNPVPDHNEVLEIEKKPSSFMNLGFADCTTKKFPLIAKAFCEDNPDLKGKKFPVFTCRQCDKEFPVEGAKELHEASHVPEEYTKCPKCNCHFSDSSRLQEHMLKHVSDLKFEESLEKVKTTDDETESSESMSQNYFLAQFGLITSEDHAEPEKDNKTESEGNADDESMMNASANNDDPSESIMSEDVDCRMTTDNEDDARSCTSETKILTIPFNTNDAHNKEETHSNKMGKEDRLSSLPSSEILTDVVAMQAGRSPASSIGSDFVFHSRGQDSPLLTLPTKHKDEVMPPMFPCKYCDAVLSNAADLKNHQILHKDSSPFQCKVCPYASTDKSTLLRHMRTHNGERPYKCKLCDYSFTTKANCERHLRQKHNLDKHDLKEQLIHRQFDVQQLLQKGNKSTGKGDQGRAICKSCGVDFFHLTSLQQHIQMNLECGFIYGCKSCMMTFPTKLEVSQHMSHKHNDVPADKIGQYFTKIENTPTLDSSPSSPPPAHSKSTTSSSGKKMLPNINTNNSLDKMSTAGTTKLLKSYLTSRSNARTNTIVTNPALQFLQSPPQSQSLKGKPDPEFPINFAKGIGQQPELLLTSTPLSKQLLPNSESVSKSEKEKQEDSSSSPPALDDQPLDLSVSRSSSPSSGVDTPKGQGHTTKSTSGSPTKQVELSLLLKEWLSRTKRQP